MEALGLLLHGFEVLFTFKTLALMMVGLVLGIFVGVLPGLGGPNGVAILLPLTFTMDPTSAIVMLSCIYWGALFGGAITSILFNIPGEAWSVATTFDGYPMAQQGRAAGISLRVVLNVWKDLPRYWATLLRSSFIGCWLGITPGGAIAASFMGYNLAKRFSKDKDSFGEGRIEGVFAPETAAH